MSWHLTLKIENGNLAKRLVGASLFCFKGVLAHSLIHYSLSNQLRQLGVYLTLYETDYYSIFYNIFELARIIKVVTLFKKISLN